MKFYRCEICGRIVEEVKPGGPLTCCGQPMKELVPGTTDAAVEKHVPEYKVEDGKVIVTVGAVEHPMVDAHYIEWVAVETNFGVQRRALAPGHKPEAWFALTENEEVKAVYAYCNLHGLWMK
ncbi:MAG: desulfoferrodoxin FeS4 iron-binding domain-containing protein [Eubacterium sp.]|nr:desulfoferrodoxin FeS4 iron-binding domain-containing protein [Eubacterium sp.]MBR3275999.1 desulfoferrodoxin FeS4 iron-binding domain-containing protein [Eubacterium sp.]